MVRNLNSHSACTYHCKWWGYFICFWVDRWDAYKENCLQGGGLKGTSIYLHLHSTYGIVASIFVEVKRLHSWKMLSLQSQTIFVLGFLYPCISKYLIQEQLYWHCAVDYDMEFLRTRSLHGWNPYLGLTLFVQRLVALLIGSLFAILMIPPDDIWYLTFVSLRIAFRQEMEVFSVLYLSTER